MRERLADVAMCWLFFHLDKWRQMGDSRKTWPRSGLERVEANTMTDGVVWSYLRLVTSKTGLADRVGENVGSGQFIPCREAGQVIVRR